MRNWCSRHPVWFMAFYALFYLTFFALLERTIQSPDLWVHCRLDDLIPFCKYAIVPYLLWFPWIPFTLFYLLHFTVVFILLSYYKVTKFLFDMLIYEPLIERSTLIIR